MTVDDAYDAIRAAFESRGVAMRKKLSAGRREILERHLRDGIEPEELPMAVEGYLWMHGGLEKPFGDGSTSGDFFRFETVFKLDKMELRVELGSQGPWRKPASREELVKARQKAAQARLDAARAQQETPRLRAVQEG